MRILNWRYKQDETGRVLYGHFIHYTMEGYLPESITPNTGLYLIQDMESLLGEYTGEELLNSTGTL